VGKRRLHTKEYFDGLSTAKCGYCPDPEHTDTAERPDYSLYPSHFIHLNLPQRVARSLSLWDDVTIPIVEQGSS
jgi:hypothetical protein